MRDDFHGDLRRLGAELTALCDAVAMAMDEATHALLDTDLVRAERVIGGEAERHDLGRRCAEHAYLLLARQSPVARDLRVVISALKAGERIVRMGDLAAHVARLVRLRHPRPVLPAEFTTRFAEMGTLAADACRDVQRTLVEPTSVCAARRERADDRTDALQRELLDTVRHADPPYPAQVGIDVALLARYVERYADQAVSVARLVDYVVTGEMPRPAHI